MQCAHDGDAAAYSARTAELGYLANVLAAGCSIQSRPFTTRKHRMRQWRCATSVSELAGSMGGCG